MRQIAGRWWRERFLRGLALSKESMWVKIPPPQTAGWRKHRRTGRDRFACSSAASFIQWDGKRGDDNAYQQAQGRPAARSDARGWAGLCVCYQGAAAAPRSALLPPVGG